MSAQKLSLGLCSTDVCARLLRLLRAVFDGLSAVAAAASSPGPFTHCDVCDSTPARPCGLHQKPQCYMSVSPKERCASIADLQVALSAHRVGVSSVRKRTIAVHGSDRTLTCRCSAWRHTRRVCSEQVNTDAALGKHCVTLSNIDAAFESQSAASRSCFMICADPYTEVSCLLNANFNRPLCKFCDLTATAASSRRTQRS